MSFPQTYQAKNMFMSSTSFSVTEDPEKIISFWDFQIDQTTTCQPILILPLVLETPNVEINIWKRVKILYKVEDAIS